jgi:hypothetical protein
MQDILRGMKLPATGRKFDLRDRIMYALDHDGALLPRPKRRRPTSTFDWANEILNPATVVTDNITFGQNLRRFMEAHIDRKFTFTSDFMDWVREHTGATLADCVEAWHRLDDRKRDPAFQRAIAANNMYCQFVRDYYANRPGASFDEVRRAWLVEREEPTVDGWIRYRPSSSEGKSST